MYLLFIFFKVKFINNMNIKSFIFHADYSYDKQRARTGALLQGGYLWLIVERVNRPPRAFMLEDGWAVSCSREGG